MVFIDGAHDEDSVRAERARSILTGQPEFLRGRVKPMLEEQGRPGWTRVDLPVDVVEPMGMETMVHFFIDGAPVCARVDPATHAEPGESLPLTLTLP